MIGTDAPDRPKLSTTRAISGAAIGNLIEWFDWYTYSALSLYFAPVFFPPANSTVQLMNAAAIFAIGFLVRPIGSWLIGSYADIKGRKSALTLSVFMMCFGSLVIAITPGYASIGIAAPALLVFARLLQGLSVGGEYGASATYITEYADIHRRGFFASFQAVTGILGQLLALGVLVLLQFVFLSRDQLESWGWRIPFVIGAAGAIVALYLRRNLDETGPFTRKHATGRAHPFRELLRHPRALITVCGLTLGGTVAYYTYTAYAQKFLVNTAGFSREKATAISAATLFIYMILQPIFGALSDRIGRRPLLIGFGVLGTLFTVPIMSAIASTDNVYVAFTLILAALVIVSGYTSINAVVKAELFPTQVRALGVAFPYAVTVSLFGGTAEYIALRFKNVGNESMFYWYVAGCILVSLVVYAFMPDTRSRDLNE